MSNEKSAKQPEETPAWMDVASARLRDASTMDESCSDGEHDKCARAKSEINAHIRSMSEYAGHHLETLKSDLEKADKPDWTETLLEKVLDLSLLTGGALVGEFIVERFLVAEAKGLGEFLKKSFEEAVPAGSKAAVAALGGKRAQPDPAHFIEAQKDAVTALYEDAADRFEESGQDELLTRRQANELKLATDSSNGVRAAYGHYVASRDTYLASLAKQTLGVGPHGVTDMSPQSDRLAAEPTHAPSLAGANLGIDRGVLIVQVFLGDDVRQDPHVLGALLNGANETIRAQYEHVDLSTVRVPRQLICTVRGGSHFIINIDEAGHVFLAEGSSEWLEARAREENPDAAFLPRVEQHRIGTQALLRDLEIDEIGTGGSR